MEQVIAKLECNGQNKQNSCEMINFWPQNLFKSNENARKLSKKPAKVQNNEMKLILHYFLICHRMNLRL